MKNILIILLFVGTGLVAQNNRNDKIKALKTAFITERLDLSSAEAEKFWPIFNIYEEKMGTLRSTERREIHLKLKGDINSLTDAEALALIDKSLALRDTDIANRRQLIEDLKPVISAKKIILLVKTENDFKRKLLDRMKHRKKNR